jgi:predicted pyridoxine 5'-phosphate oxidase superfamily flavin-nucleotide-binding protein
MTPPHPASPSDVAFSDSVKAVQTRKGSRADCDAMERQMAWPSTIDAPLKQFIQAQSSAFLASASAAGRPYVQHRGGPPGFLQVLDGTTIAFADFQGNRQFITQGNLAENPQAHLLLIDFFHRHSIRFWGTARVVENDATLVERVTPAQHPDRVQQVVVFSLRAWDSSCAQHIPMRYDAEDLNTVLEERERHIAHLEAELRQWHARMPRTSATPMPARQPLSAARRLFGQWLGRRA